MAYTLVNPGDPIHATQLNQVINSLIGTAAAGQVLSFSALNDSTHYALTVQNLDGTNSNALNVLKSDGTVLLQARGTGVTVSALTVTGLTAFSGGVQIGPNASTLVRPMPNDSSSMLIQSPNLVNVASLSSNGTMLSSDAYYDGTTWQRGSNSSAVPSLLNCANGALTWGTVPAASGAMPAWTQRMGLDASGNLTLNTGGLTVNQPSTFQSTLTVSGLITGNGGMNTLALNASSIGATGNVTVNGTVTAGAVTVNGTLTGNGQTNINALSCTTINTNGQAITCGNISATGNVTVQNSASNVVPFTVGGAYEHIEHGQVTISGVNNSTGANQSITFARAFNSNPIVIISVGAVSTGDVQQWHAAAQSITTTTFNARVFNTSGGTGNCQVYWFAMGN